MIVLEQFLRMLTPDLQIWIKERDPKTASEAAALANVFMSLNKITLYGLPLRLTPSPCPSKPSGKR